MIDYATKYCLAATVTPTARGQDALSCLLAAVQRAQRLLSLADLRADRGEVDLVDETTGALLLHRPSTHRHRLRQRPVLPRRPVR